MTADRGHRNVENPVFNLTTGVDSVVGSADSDRVLGPRHAVGGRHHRWRCRFDTLELTAVAATT